MADSATTPLPATTPAVAEAPPRDLRRRAARGTVTNALFLIAINGLTTVRGFAAAGLLAAAEYGVWGVLSAILGALYLLKDLGIADRFVQQDEEDQELAFQRAFTLELMVTSVLMLLMVIALPLYALLIDEPDIVLPGIVLATSIPALALQAPVWIFYRRLEFFRQRSLEAVEPLAAFAVTIGLAVAGAGYWSLVVGAVAGIWAKSIVAAVLSPYKFRLRFDRQVTREYAGFSWPLLVGSLTGLAIVQTTIFAGNAAAGLAGVGIIAVANAMTNYAGHVDQIITDTMYPVVCRVRDRADLLLESFVKSNRLALMWGLPFGFGFTLFCADLVHHVIGNQWAPGITLMRTLGVIAALSQFGFNWTAYMRATGNTKPIAVVAPVTGGVFIASVIPLSIAYGLDGFALAGLVLVVVQMGLRLFYLRRMFPGLRVVADLGRSALPVVPAVAAVLALRGLEGERGLAAALVELALYVAIVVVAVLALERKLLVEVLGYFRRPAPAAA